MAHYSVLFTLGLGLLAERGSPTTARPSPTASSPSSSFFSKLRKGSLPAASLSPATNSYTFAIEVAESSPPAIEFSDPFASSASGESSPRQRSAPEFRSFLSLDLAESQSVRSAKHARAAMSPLDTNAMPLVPPRSASPHRRGPAPPSPLLHSPLPSPLPSGSSRRPSRDSLRNLPSPKPAPSATLPEIPFSLPPVAPSPPTSPSSSHAPSARSSLSAHRPSHSAPSMMSRPSSALAFPLPPVASTSARRPTPASLARSQSYLSFSSATTSVRTTRKRTAHRNDALAALEGRGEAAPRRRTPSRNFMSMSDDEDEDDVPPPPRRRVSSTPRRRVSSAQRAPPPTPATLTRFPGVDEEESVLPSPAVAPPLAASWSLPAPRASVSSPPPKTRRRRSTMESWFPLANFIDFKDDDLAGWRGLVEIASAV
ncbi:hypothetical protein FA95DRAFT_1684423 [Auriscalpium vulgare]|uniref:Uncharacterized protein n=1 Tax=Auriscalpium vulgare TaxID=40419 RepID=A0ACB8R588_9AGAM|nr:hypothetical protein FA95DRAFT_1684423 [Auriscalpium vulgare]